MNNPNESPRKDERGAVSFEGKMLNGRSITFSRRAVAEIVEKEDGRCIVRLHNGSFYHLLESYYDVMDWYSTGVIKPTAADAADGYVHE